MDDPGMAEVAALDFWQGEVEIWPLTGGITNRNYGVAQADGQRFAVRLGADILYHGAMRFNELAAAKAAAQAGISPEVLYSGPGVMVTRLLPGRTLTPEEIRAPENRRRIIGLLKKCHAGVFLRGPLLAFWVFHINRSYIADLGEAGFEIAGGLPRLSRLNDALELLVGKVDMVFGHNDLLAGNLFNDGTRLWLLDWDYAGFNSPLFDLANLSSNNGFTAEDDAALLEEYFQAPVSTMWQGFLAMKCASLLREALWSAVSQMHSSLDFDYAGYTAEYLERLDTALKSLGGPVGLQ